MDKLIKAIPDDHMAIINAKAEALGVSSSSYIRSMIRKDVGVMDIRIKNVPYKTIQKVRRDAVAAGLTVDEYLFLNL